MGSLLHRVGSDWRASFEDGGVPFEGDFEAGGEVYDGGVVEEGAGFGEVGEGVFYVAGAFGFVFSFEVGAV